MRIPVLREVADVAPAVPAPKSARYWVVPVVRAVIALIAAAVITFTRDAHTAQFGLIVFGVFAVLEGAVLVLSSLRTLADRLTRKLFLVQGAIGVLAGVLALALSGSGLGLYLFVVSVWAALTGFLELYSGLRSRTKDGAARDWIVTGALTAVLALTFLLIPSDAILAIGLFGAWAVIVGVFQAIGGASLRASARGATAEHNVGSGS
ncbi:HdeD family acid-resistance protein [Leifsonia sp. NPDC058230]|uniref:HdeD family acid-resistance protein n=1 Tax=Leifsonia sp. NPDC058230 TaxID=3346391 RepID=UPI0036DB4605